MPNRSNLSITHRGGVGATVGSGVLGIAGGLAVPGGGAASAGGRASRDSESMGVDPPGVSVGAGVSVGVGVEMIQLSVVWQREHWPRGCPAGRSWL